MSTQRKPAAGIYGRQSHGKTKSIGEQIAECRADAEAQGYQVRHEYQDATSASRHARKPRKGWPQLLADLAAGEIAVVVMWESSRGDRTLASWAAFLDVCRDRGVLIRVTDHRRTYDMREARDWRTLAEDGVDNAWESEKTRQRILRSVRATAAAGRPSGQVPYGYRRHYDPVTRELVRQEPDPDTAPIVREIFNRIAAGQTIAEVVEDLNRRAVPPPSSARRQAPGKRWYPSRVREICRSETYLGVRRHHGERHAAVWPAIVDADQFWAAKRVLDGRAGRGWRAGRAEHLLTSVVDCGECGSPLAGQVTPQLSFGAVYRCRAHGCVRFPAGELEEQVLAYVLGRLARADVYRRLRRAGEGAEAEVGAARAEAARLRARLEEWRDSAVRGETTPATMARIERDLSAQIEAADRRAEQAGLPPGVAELAGAGDELPLRWAAMPLAGQRDVIGALVKVTLHRTEKYARPRVAIEWKGTA